MADSIAFIDLQAQRAQLGTTIDTAIARVLAHGRYILGPEVGELEAALSSRTDNCHVVSCANGTDALQLSLRAFGAAPGDAIFVPAFTFAATAEVVCLVGATPVFVDIDPATYNISADSLKAAIAATRQDGTLRPAGIIPVDLFGQPADYDAVEAIARDNGLWVLEDAAQSFGAALGTRKCGTFGDAATTSFFPAKPLGAYGDGGAIFTADAELAGKLRSLRVHGHGQDKYDNVEIGTNSRLDTLQAAILLEKLKLFDAELDSRDRIAARYTELLSDIVETPLIMQGASSVWAQYTIRTRQRDELRQALNSAGIPTAIYYPRPLSRQSAYTAFPVAPGGVPASDAAAAEVLSLPMHPYLDETQQDRVIDAIRAHILSLRQTGS